MLRHFSFNGRQFLARATHHRVARNSLADVFALGWPILATLLVTPVLVSRLGDTNYGIWILARSILGFSGWFDLGMTYALVKFMAEYIATKNEHGLSASITAAYAIYLGSGLILGACVFVLAGPISQLFDESSITPQELTQIIRITAFGMPAVLLMIGNTAIPRGLQRFELSTLIRVFQTSLLLGSAVVMALVTDDLKLVVLSTVLSFWATALFSSFLAWRALKGLKIRLIFSKQYFWAMGRFSFFVFLSSLGTQLFSTFDKLLIGAAFNASYVTYYSVCISVAIPILSLAGALSGALMPAVSSLYAQGNIDKIWQYFKFTMIFVSAVVMIIGSILLVISGPFLELWMGTEFAEKSLSLFRILIIAYMGIAFNAPAYHIAYGIGKPAICAVGAVSGGIIALGAIYILGHQMGLNGLGWGNLGFWWSVIIVIYVYWTLSPRTRPAAGFLPQR